MTGENVRPPEIKSESYFLGDVGCGFVAHRLAVVAAGVEATSRANYLGNAQAEIRGHAAAARGILAQQSAEGSRDRISDPDRPED